MTVDQIGGYKKPSFLWNLLKYWIILVLGLILLVVSVAYYLYKQNNSLKKSKNNSIKPIKIERQKQQTKEEKKIYKGKRGGRYKKDKTKDGSPYLRYF